MKTTKSLWIFAFLLILASQSLRAQSYTLKGVVLDRITKEPLAGAAVFVENSSRGAVAGENGSFSLEVPEPYENILISYLGYKSLSLTAVEYKQIRLPAIELDQELVAFSNGAVIVGSHYGSRTAINSSVPVDRFPLAVMEQTGQTDLSQQINSLAPSFYSTRLTYSDATDHMDPASLRGLNPDQTLILVNGKRHHPSAVVNTLGVVGRGSVINDLNTIPTAAISRVEILRDGASAQYGSDAIAGVINIVLKENTGKLNFKSQVGQNYEGDGLQTSIAANYGFKLGKKGGFMNLSTDFRKRQASNRAGIYQGLIYRTADQEGLTLEQNRILDNQEIEARGLSRNDFRMQLGNSALINGNIYLNSKIPVFKIFELYSFGGVNIRNSKSAGDFRLPNDAARSNLILHPDGFLPEIEAKLNDQFISNGIRGELFNWSSDLSCTYGRNAIAFFVNNSTNASMGAASPSGFESGEISYNQSLLNLDFSRDLGSQLSIQQFRLSFGTEFRIENYKIMAGEENSWINQNQASYPGAQGYPGYQPSDETDASRNNMAVYANLNTKPLKNLLFDAALRFENYSDFGGNLSGKLSTLYSITPWLNLRGSVSTGFRAPALHQSYYNYTGSYYFGGFLYEVLTARNDNPVTKAFGIPELKEETSGNYSFGITAKPSENTNLSFDFYQIDVKDRIVLSGFFYKGFGISVVDSLLADLTTTGGAQFFTNAVDTRSRGMDFVLSHEIHYSGGLTGLSFGLNLSKTRITGDLHSSEEITDNGLSGMLFDRQSQALLERSQPSMKSNITLTMVKSKFSCVLRTTFYGEVSYLGQYNTAEDQVYSSKWISDIRLGYKFNGFVSFLAGANNLFNVYPDENNQTLQNQGRFIYNTAVTQFGFNGGYYYGGLAIEL